MKRTGSFGLALLLGLLLLAPGHLVGQSPFPASDAGLKQSLPGLGLGGGQELRGQELQLSARFSVEENGRGAKLQVQAKPAAQWHVYSLTQQRGGPQPSEIKVAASDAFELLGRFEPDQDPQVSDSEFFDVPIEKHEGVVTWSAPLRLAEGVDPDQLEIRLTYSGQVCQDSGSCIPFFDQPVPVEFAGFYPASAAGPFRADNTHATIRGHVEPQTAAPGSTVRLVLSAEPDPKWYVYAHAERDPQAISKPTLIVLTNNAGWKTAGPTPSAPPVEKPTGLDAEPVQRFHQQPVQWTLELQVPEDLAEGEHVLSGMIGYQTCTSSRCDLPAAAEFQVRLPVAAEPVEGQLPLEFSAARYESVARVADQLAEAGQPADSSGGGSTLEERQSLAVVFALAFLAGLILNVMPCVLPVIGLKIMSFVQQAGANRLRIFALNMWFSLGLLSVFMILATISVVLRALQQQTLGWGEQFQYAGFSIPLAAIVFVFALSFLGVWELPIPGFVGRGKTTELAEQHGSLGAFLKGVLATLLATPCSGPLLVPSVGFAISQPPALTYATFFSIGLGMALPYLIIGAFPRLISVLPKPGAWMETFKQLMGFVLLGTVVWIFSFLGSEYIIPTLALMLGLGLATWWLGRTPVYADLNVRVKAWAGALAIAALFILFAFTRVGPTVIGWALDRPFLLAGLVLLAAMGLVGRRLAGQASDAPGTARRWMGTAAAGLLVALVTLTPAFSTVVGLVAPFTSLVPAAELPWEPFTRAALDEHREQGHTVLVDFTADW